MHRTFDCTRLRIHRALILPPYSHVICILRKVYVGRVKLDEMFAATPPVVMKTGLENF